MNRHIGPSTKKPGWGLGKATVKPRQAILNAFQETSKPVTVRQMFYMLSVPGAVEKTENDCRKVQRQLVLMRRDEMIPYGWNADNTRWQRKPRTWDSLPELVFLVLDIHLSGRFYLWLGLELL